MPLCYTSLLEGCPGLHAHESWLNITLKCIVYLITLHLTGIFDQRGGTSIMMTGKGRILTYNPLIQKPTPTPTPLDHDFHAMMKAI